MEAARMSIGLEDLLTRIRQRLLGINNTARQVVWHSGSHRVLIHAESVRVRLLRGWLVVSLDLQTDQTGRNQVDFVFFLGAPGEADGNTAAVRCSAATKQAAQLAEVFAGDLQRVIWDAILDAIEVSLQIAGRRFPNQPLTLRGFQSDPEALMVDVLAGGI